MPKAGSGFLALVLLTSCAIRNVNPIPARAAGTAAALGPQDFILESVGQSPAVSALGEWLPTPAEAGEAKTALFELLFAAPHSVSGPPAEWAEEQRLQIAARIQNYALQYVGVRGNWGAENGRPDPAGDRVVMVNGFCRLDASARAMLTKHQFLIFDGGPCYFRAFYNLRRRQVVWFSVNGR